MPKPEPIRILFEEDIQALEALQVILEYYGSADIKSDFLQRDFTKPAFLNMARVIKTRISENFGDYNGKKYIIMVEGRRRLSLGLRREPSVYVGAEYGANFYDACRIFFSYHFDLGQYNKKRNTLNGRFLFEQSTDSVGILESGVNTTSNGYAGWFKISNQTFTFTEEKTKTDADLRIKLLNRVFDNMLKSRD